MMRYTAVFDFEDGKEPAVGINDGWLGGKLCAVQFSDALKELEILRQEPIGCEFARVLDENRWDLYERSDVPPNAF